MFRNAIIAAGLVAAASVTAAAPAAAHASVTVTITAPYLGAFAAPPRPYLACTPTFISERHKHNGRVYYTLVQAGQNCHWVYPSPPLGPYRAY